MKRLIEDIKNKTFKSSYLLFGSERYLVTQYRAKLKDALLDGADDMNFNAFEGKSVDFTEVCSIGNTLPFFADHRVIQLDGTGLFKAAGDTAKQMAAWIKELPETTTVIFTETEVDKRNVLYKAVNELGTACEMNGPDEKDLRIFVANRLKKDGRAIREKDVAYLLETVGYDMQNLCNELEKLVSYTMGRTEVTASDIDTVCVHQITGRIFDLTDAVAEGRKDDAIRHYSTMIRLREKPAAILYRLTTHFNNLLLAKDLVSHGRNSYDVASALGIKQYPADKYCAQSRKFTIEKLRKATELGIELENDFKSGKMPENMTAEYYVISLINMLQSRS